jgi:microcystin-dependent protein
VPIHVGQGAGTSNYVLGEITGTESVTLGQNQMPTHTHLVNADNAIGGVPSPIGHFPAAVGNLAAEKMWSTGASGTMAATTLQTAGGSLPFTVVQPVLCVNFIIATVGIFPSRN